MVQEAKVVAAVGSTAVTGRGARGKLVELAMAHAVEQASAEAKTIWDDPSLSEEEKREQIAVLMHTDSIRARKLKAREYAKAAWRAQEDAASKKASEKPDAE